MSYATDQTTNNRQRNPNLKSGDGANSYHASKSLQDALNAMTQFVDAIIMRVRANPDGAGNIIQTQKDNGAWENQGAIWDVDFPVAGICTNDTNSSGVILRVGVGGCDDFPVRFIFGVDRPIQLTKVYGENSTVGAEYVIWR